MSQAASLLVLAFASVGLVTVSACALPANSASDVSPASSSSTASAGGATSSACTASPTDTACATCGKSSCCDEITACENVPDCDAYGKCAASCTSGACLDGCAAQFPKGAAPYNAVTHCNSTSCATSCQASTAGTHAAVDNTACTACDKSECTATRSTCDDNPQCNAFGACAASCASDDDTCRQGCANQFPKGLGDWDNELCCRANKCSPQCN